MPADILSIVRDIAIIVMAVMVTVAAATLTIVVLQTFPALRRGARNFETASRLMLETSSRITGLVAMGSELGIFLWDLMNRFRNRSNAEPPSGDNNARQN